MPGRPDFSSPAPSGTATTIATVTALDVQNTLTTTEDFNGTTNVAAGADYVDAADDTGEHGQKLAVGAKWNGTVNTTYCFVQWYSDVACANRIGSTNGTAVSTQYPSVTIDALVSRYFRPCVHNGSGGAVDLKIVAHSVTA